ncbi:MAG TPA: DIP1984 family protein [Anaerolineae bacterium]|nr:DIP1984 family protein [Anaerolineae bacterium]
MKLAEALILRADLQKRIEQLKSRIVANVMIQEGDEPAEDAQKLLADLERDSGELVGLIQRINRTNSQTELEDGLTLADALAVRDNLATRHRIYRDVGAEAVVSRNRFSRSEVKFVSTVSAGAMQAQADDLAREHRELDARIQATNWSTELL